MLGTAPTMSVPATPARGARAAFRRPGDAATVPPGYYEVLEPLLPQVRKPAQYVGGEHNQVVTPWLAAQTRWLLCYPDTYEVGQPNQGIQILYELLNERATALAERAYAPWTDLEALMREQGIPAFSLESHRPVWAFDVFGVSLPHELGHTNLLNLLDLGGVPIHADRRTAEDPIVLVGGHAAYNPEPLAPFVDAAVMGDGEQVTLEIDDVVRAWKAAGGSDRRQLLRELARVEGVYVPAFYEPRYTPDGRLKQTVPIESGVPTIVPKRTIQDLEEWQYPQKQIVPMTETVHERFSVEIFRGCTRGCRFCQAGMITRPVRERRPETIQKLVEEGVRNTGFEEVGLLSLSSADHSAIGPVARDLADAYEGTVTSLSLPSTRVDAFNVTLSNELSRNGRRTGLTFAPEAGSERMRAVINKMVSEADLLRTAEVAFSEGWRHIKLYFMVGLPTERDEDVLAIADLGIKTYEIARRHGRANKVTISVGGFVPKPHTPFQWAAQDSPEEIKRKLSLIRHAIKDHGGLKLRTNDPEEGVIEGLLARGDRRVAAAVERAWRLGARFDGWHEMPTLDTWRQAMAETDVSLEWYSHRERDEKEALPWDHLDSGLEKSWLWEDWQDARSDKQLDDCRWSPCYDCGVCPGLSIQHDTGYTGGFQLPVLPSHLGGKDTLPTTPERYASGG
ncbi:TIGR03960 family B12-binding radical SAM protein [Egicoccus sp. AB-alg2]|uniref:TIGR03960 family B12-binding radical SAM protein n=1 Tax=Egicoccus sp. AB-alg2 TaxID=3242693 RepID=UPI00359E13E6